MLSTSKLYFCYCKVTILLLQLLYRILSGNNANLVSLNDSTGQLSLSPQLNTNVPKLASMEVSVSGRCPL